MAVTLCFDFGNTRLKCAVFQGNEMEDLLVLEDDKEHSVLPLLEKYKPEFTLLSSVVHHDPGVEELLAAHSRFHKLDYRSKLPITTPAAKPETIGADRLGLVTAAVYLHPGQHNLVIGAGTCITYNFVNKFHEFLGGSISPGMGMRFRAMNSFTALLPVVKADWNFPLVGYDTRTNLLSGVVLGMSREIDGIISMYAEKYSDFNVLFTGGDSAFFAPFLKSDVITDPNLLYKGLYAISECNR